MQIAKDSQGHRVHIDDAERGKNYYCQTCEQKLIQKRGEIRIHHFAHYNPRGKGDYIPCCDSWEYDMSEWHVEWQNRFPKENQEVVVTDGRKKHIADVLINGTVVEFQHSPIKFAEFQDRNQFYTHLGYKVVWIFDFTELWEENEITNDYKENEYVWEHPWTVFRKMDFDTLENVTLYTQFSNPDDLYQEYPLEMVIHAYSNFKSFYTDINHALSISQLINLVRENNELLFFKRNKSEDLIHSVENGKTLFDLWQSDFTGMMVQNLVNNKVMAINGARGYMYRELRGREKHIIGYYAHIDSFTGRFKVKKERKYVVWQAEDSIWRLLNFFKATPEQLEEWEKEKERQAKEAQRRAKEAFEQRQREEEKRQQEYLLLKKQEEERKRILIEEARAKAKAEEKAREESIRYFKDHLDELLSQQSKVVIDPQGIRWIKCGSCGKNAPEGEFIIYGGATPNLGLCRDCSRAGKSFTLQAISTHENLSPSYQQNEND